MSDTAAATVPETPEPRLSAAALGQWQAATDLERAITLGVVALGLLVYPELPTLYSHVTILFVLGAAGLPVLAWRALGRGGQARPLVAAALVAVCFAIAGLVSALLSVSPGIGIFGVLEQQTGWLFTLAAVGCWALGTAISDRGRPLIVSALVFVSVVQALVALGQQLAGENAWGNYEGRPAGLVGNPVFLGMILSGGLVLAAGRFRQDPRRRWPAVVVIGVGIGICGQRLPVIATAVIVAAELWLGFRTRRTPAATSATSDGFGVRMSAAQADPRWRSAAFAMLAVVTVAAGTAIDSVRHLGVVSYQLGETAEGTYGDRFAAWQAAVHAIVHRPLFGFGLGQFEAGTLRYFSVSFIAANEGDVFGDAHNFLIEYATDTGIVGLLLLLAFLAVHARAARGRLLGYVVALLGISLFEPLNVVTVPLAFFALGVALRQGLGARPPDLATTRPPNLGLGGGRGLAVAASVLALCAAAGGALLLVGESFLNATTTTLAEVGPGPAISQGHDADDLLPWWAEPASNLAAMHAYVGLDGNRIQQQAAIYWADQAAKREPFNPYLWMDLAGEDVRFGTQAQVDAAVQRALDAGPYSYQAMNIAGVEALTHRDRPGAVAWFRRSLAINPSQPHIGLLLSGRCPNLLFTFNTGRCRP